MSAPTPAAGPAGTGRPTLADVVALGTGRQVAARTVHLTRADLARYAQASGDHNPIHASPAAAAAAGLPDVVAHGMLTMALTGALASAWAGDPAAVVEHGARFTGLVPVPVDGVDVEVAAVLAAVDEDARTVRLDLTATCAGARVLGRARATVRLG